MSPNKEIPSTMKAVRVAAYNEAYKLTSDTPVPQPSSLGPNDLLVKIAAASHCHTDEMVRSGIFGTKLPCTASHEGAGTVVAVGGGGGSPGDVTDDVESSSTSAGAARVGIPPEQQEKLQVQGDLQQSLNSNNFTITSRVAAGAASSSSASTTRMTSFKVGDRVMCGLPFHPCSTCSDCIGPESSRRGQYCANLEGHVGVHRDGCMAEYVVVDRGSTTKLPDEIRFQSAAPLACAGRTVWRGVTTCGLQRGSGQWLAIVGSGGGLGHLGVQFARKMGLNVIGVDARDEGLEVTRQYRDEQQQQQKQDGQPGGGGVVVVAIDAREGQDAVVKKVQEVTGGRGADATLVLSDSPDAAAMSAALTRMHGTMVQIAQPDQVSVPFQELVFRDIRIRGSLLCSAEESQEMLEFIAEHGLDVKVNLFEGLDQIEEVMKLVKGGKIKGKAVVIVDKQQAEDEKKNGAKY